MTRPADIVPPRLLSREPSSKYAGVGTTLWDEMVADGRMPQPIRINSRVLWDRWEIDEAITALRSSDDNNPWDEVAA